MEYTILILFSLFYTLLAWRSLSAAFFVVFLLLPTYLIRFHIGPLPATLLEIMIWIIIIVWLVKKGLAACNIFNIHSISYFFTRHRLLTIGIVLFFLGATISLFTSTNTRAALGEWKAFYVEPVILFIILITTLRQSSVQGDSCGSQIDKRDCADKSAICNLQSTIILPLILCGLATSLLAIYQHSTGWHVPYAFWENRQTYRVTSWYGYPNAVGLFLAPLVPLAIYGIQGALYVISSGVNERTSERSREIPFLPQRHSSVDMQGIPPLASSLGRNDIKKIFNKFQFLCFLFFIPCSILAIWFSKSTSGLIGVAAGIGTLLLWNKKTRWPAIVIGFLSLFGLLSIPSIRTELLAQNRSGQIRIAIWSETARLLRDHPLAGAGLASYSQKIAPYHQKVHGENIEIFHLPHNLFLAMWVNTGFLGLIGFILILVWFYRAALTNLKSKILNQKSITPFLTASMTALLVTGLVDSPYIKNDLAIFFWLLVSLLVIFRPSSLDIKIRY